MSPLSEDWPDFSSLTPESEKYKQIQLLISSTNFEYLKKRAIDLRRRQDTILPLEFDCSIDLTHFVTGFNNVVVEVAFSDNVY